MAVVQAAGFEEVGAALYLEGVAQAEQGNLAEAVTALQQCAKIEPDHGASIARPEYSLNPGRSSET